ncbi:porin [Azospirillum thermophilum]|uniref:Porin n=1 Tax=Azospirillum thermophilum TaxID=2202148 RepID=A0A2S2CNW2_9PROT|nr:porin [Azospirillum thermophilum]AWK86060.1 porin [Azospirillum thermophilum]
MKRSLTLGCAAIALAATCGTASAQKFDVMIGGDAYFEAGFVDQDRDQGLRTTEFRNRMRLVVTPTAKADNGLEYGARLRLRAVDNGTGGRTTDNDRAFIFVSGAFGTVQAGTINGLSDEYGVIGPNPDGVQGSPDGNWAAFYAATDRRGVSVGLPYVIGSLRTLESGDASTKVIYLSPSFSGFKLGAAYTPTEGSSNTNVNRVKRTSSNFRDMGEVQATYTGEFSGVSIEGSAAYQFGKADAPTNIEDLSSVHAGLNVGYAGFKLGGSYAYSGKSGYAKGSTGLDKQQVWLVGAQYTTGPLILAATYTDARGAVGLGLTGAANNARTHLWQAGVTYTVAPGLTTGLEYSYVDNKQGTLNNDANIIMWDTRFAF